MSAILFEKIMVALDAKPNDAGLTEFLSSLHWPLGLQQEMLRSMKMIPIRFFIFDDSGSVRFHTSCSLNFFKKKLLANLLIDGHIRWP